MTLIFGHRGAAGTYPENTMISFQAAEKAGADGIELDVQMSKDGALVVIHDEKVDRTTNGKGWIKDLTLKEIQSLDASFKFSEKYGVCRVPTLEEVLSWTASNNLVINIELKNSLVPYPGIEEKVISMVHSFKQGDRVILSSFNHYSLAKCHSLAPEMETAVLYMEWLFEPWHYAKTIGAKGIHPYHPAAAPAMLQEALRHDIAVRPFTVNDPKMMKRFMDEKCSAFFTDYPEKAAEVFQK